MIMRLVGLATGNTRRGVKIRQPNRRLDITKEGNSKIQSKFGKRRCRRKSKDHKAENPMSRMQHTHCLEPRPRMMGTASLLLEKGRR